MDQCSVIRENVGSRLQAKSGFGTHLRDQLVCRRQLRPLSETLCIVDVDGGEERRISAALAPSGKRRTVENDWSKPCDK